MARKSSKVEIPAEPKIVKPAAAKEKKTRARKPAAPAPVAQNYESLQQEIARMAYSFWIDRGCMGGDPVDDWLRAEREVMSKLTVLSQHRQ